jgi:hypothetical protein
VLGRPDAERTAVGGTAKCAPQTEQVLFALQIAEMIESMIGIGEYIVDTTDSICWGGAPDRLAVISGWRARYVSLQLVSFSFERIIEECDVQSFDRDAL